MTQRQARDEVERSREVALVEKCPDRPNLVVCTCGERTPVVLGIIDGTRQFDVAIINFAPSVRSYRDIPVELHFEHPGHKWTNIKRFLETNDLTTRYDFFWFPDDDIRASAADANRLFEIARREGLDLCQPSLSHNSFTSFKVTKHRPGRDVRRTNFVEIMCPLFQANALKTCLPTFDLTHSGWGLDYLWPTLVDSSRVGVVHAVQVQHTQPVQSKEWRMENGLTPGEEMAQLLRSFGLSAWRPAELDE
jgi:hypothetical protein